MHPQRDIIFSNSVHLPLHCDAHILICCQVQTDLSERLVSAHSLSSTSLLNGLILTILAKVTTKILLLSLWGIV